MTRQAPSSATPPLAAAWLERFAAEEAPRVVVLAGAERWFREQALAAIVRKVHPEGDPGTGVVRLDAKAEDDHGRVAWALDEVRTPSLFGERKVVAIEHAEAAEPVGARPAGKGKPDPILALATAALAGPPTGAVLVLGTARAAKGRSSVDAAGLLAAGATVVDCRALYDTPGAWRSQGPPFDTELTRFLARRMEATHAKELALPDAQLLVDRVGSDLGELADALATLALAVGERRRVTAEDVEAGTGRTREDPMWRLTDAVLDRDLVRALDLTTAAFDRGLTDQRGMAVVKPDNLAIMLVAVLHRAFRKVLQASEALARGEPPEGALQGLGVAPFQADAFLARCRHAPADLYRRHGAFLEAELGLKTGTVPPRLAFERLVVRLATPAPGVAARA